MTIARMTAVARWSVIATFAVSLAGCSLAPGASPDASQVSVTPVVATPATTTLAASDKAATPAASAPPVPIVGEPPIATLIVEGGDPVAGQLGTYTWDGGGSDSPWLPGAPIAAATGEVLRMTLSPDISVADWSAVIAPAANGDERGALNVGAGPGPIQIVAPAPGAWTLAVTVRAEDRDSATWFWRLDVP